MKTNSKSKIPWIQVSALLATFTGFAHGATPIYSLGYEHNNPSGGNNATVVDPAVIATQSVLSVGAGLGQYFVFGNIGHYAGIGQTTLAGAIADNDYIEYEFTTTVSLPATTSLLETSHGAFSSSYFGHTFGPETDYNYSFLISTTPGFSSPTTLSSGVSAALPGVDVFDFVNDATSYPIAPATTYYFRAYLYNSVSGNAVFDDTGLGIIPEPSSILTLGVLAGLSTFRRRRAH